MRLMSNRGSLLVVHFHNANIFQIIQGSSSIIFASAPGGAAVVGSRSESLSSKLSLSVSCPSSTGMVSTSSGICVVTGEI